MKILDTYDSLEDIPEELRENYVEREDGKFGLEFVSGLKSALRKERENVSTLTGKLKSTEQSVADKIAEREAELQQDFSQREAAIRKEVTESFLSEKKKVIAVTALQKAGGNIELLSDKVASKIAIGDDGEPYVADRTGTPVLDADGNRLSVDGLVESFRGNPTFAGAFKGTGQSGGGSAGAEGGNGMANGALPDFRRSQMTPRQKVDFIKEHGNDKFMQLPQ